MDIGNFRHFNVSEISLYLDGQQQEGIKPMALNYADSYYIRAYNTLFSGTGKICRDEGIAIDRNDYANAYALYTFDLTVDLGDEENSNLMRQGSVRLVLKPSTRDDGHRGGLCRVRERDRDRQKQKRHL